MVRQRIPLAALAGALLACSVAREPQVAAKLVITVDVEALPYRQSSDHIERLIFGRFGAHEVGVEEMMRIADRYGVKLSFFLDFCETALYGDDAIREIAQVILSKGHDLQIHCHPIVFPDAFWKARGLERPTVDEDQYSPAHATEMIRYVKDAAVRFGGAEPVAYRGGGLFYGENVLAAMSESGLRGSFNYSWREPGQRGSQEDLPVFRWSNGIVEFPLGVHFNRDDQQETLDIINLVDDESVDRLHGIVRDLARKHGRDSVLVMIGHSWSLLDLDPQTNHFYYKSDARRDAFERFLRDLPGEVRIVAAREVIQDIQNHEIVVDQVRDLALSQNLPPATAASITPDPPSPHKVGTPVVFSASAMGSSDYGYQFWLRAPGSSTFEVVQQYGVGSSWTMPASMPPGDYRVQVHVRTGGAGGFGAMGSVNYTVAPNKPPAPRSRPGSLHRLGKAGVRASVRSGR
jgi:hypothetical protein